MDGYQVRFAGTLREKLEKLIADRTTSLSTSPAPDYAGYMDRVGFIKGLRYALQEMDQVQTDLSNPDKKPITPVTLQRYEA